jgi:hypothetical protein
LLRTVVESCPTKVFLAKPGMDLERVRDLFHLNQTEAALVAQLRHGSSCSSRRPDLAKVVNLHVDPQSYRIYATASAHHARPHAATERRDPSCRNRRLCQHSRKEFLMARSVVALAVVMALTSATSSAQATREVHYSSRSIVQVNTRLRFTTMIVLPEKEEILDFVCGDKDFWIVSGGQNLAYVKPAKAGATTNLNLVTSTGSIYSFLTDGRGGRA